MQIEIAAALLMEQIVRDVYSDKHSSAIQPLQWSILRYLREASLEARDVKSIGRYVGVTPAPVSRAIRTLETRGLVTRGEHPKSKRSVTVTLTEHGRVALEGDPILKIARRIELLDTRERKIFINSLRQLMLQDQRF